MNLGGNPNRDEGGRFHYRADIGNRDTISHCLRLGRSLDGSDLIGDGCGLRLQKSFGLVEMVSGTDQTFPKNRIAAYIVNHLSADPDARVGCWLNNGMDLSFGDEVGLCLLDRFRGSVNEGIGGGIDVGQCLRFGSSQSVLLDLCPIDDFGGHPYTGCGLHFN